MESQTVDSAAAEIEALLGEPTDVEAEGTPEKEPEVAEDEELSEEEESEHPEEDSDDDPDSDDDESEEEVEDEETEEQDQIESINELAEALEVPQEELENTLTINVGTQNEPVTLAELKRGFLRESDYTHKTTELAEQRKEFQSKAAQAQQYYEQNLAQVAKYVELAEQVFIPQQDEAEMARLRETNPAEWTARNQEHQQRQQVVQALKQEAANSWQQNIQAQQGQTQAQRQEILQRAQADLHTLIPDWNAETKTGVESYLVNTYGQYGYTEENLSAVIDPVLVDLARKARLYDEGQKQVDVAKKKIKRVPKMVKSTAPKSKAKVKRSNLTRAKQRLSKTHHVKDAASVIEQLL